MAIDSSKLGVFNRIRNENGNGIVQFKDEDRTLLACGGNHAKWQLFSRMFFRIGCAIKWYFTDVNENDRVRTQFLHNLVDAIGTERIEQEDRNALVPVDDSSGIRHYRLNDRLLAALERILTPGVFCRKDFQLDDSGNVISGNPLTERRVTKICDKVKDLEKREKARPQPVDEAEEETRSLASAIVRQESHFYELFDPLRRIDKGLLENIIRTVLINPNMLSDGAREKYRRHAGTDFAGVIDAIVRAIVRAIRNSEDPYSDCEKAINDYNFLVGFLRSEFQITSDYLAPRLQAQGADVTEDEKNRTYGFLRLLNCALANHNPNSQNPVKLGNLAGGMANTEADLGNLLCLWKRWDQAKRLACFSSLVGKDEPPTAMEMVSCLANEKDYPSVIWAVRRVIYKRFQYSGIAPLNEDEIKFLASRLCTKLLAYLNVAKDEKSESDCIEYLYKNLRDEGNNDDFLFKLTSGRTLRLTNGDVWELFYDLFDLPAHSIETNAQAQGQKPVTNLAASELKSQESVA